MGGPRKVNEPVQSVKKWESSETGKGSASRRVSSETLEAGRRGTKTFPVMYSLSLFGRSACFSSFWLWNENSEDEKVLLRNIRQSSRKCALNFPSNFQSRDYENTLYSDVGILRLLNSEGLETKGNPKWKYIDSNRERPKTIRKAISLGTRGIRVDGCRLI